MHRSFPHPAYAAHLHQNKNFLIVRLLVWRELQTQHRQQSLAFCCALLIGRHPRRFFTAAVAMVVFGQSAFTEILYCFNSPDKPNTIMLIPYLLIVYARCLGNHFLSMFNGGEILRIWPPEEFFKCGMHALLIRNVPRTLMSCIRS